MFKRLAILVSFVLAVVLSDNLHKKKGSHFCNFKKDCEGLTPQATGCVSFGGAAGQCYWQDHNDPEKKRYRYTFDA
jgi:hypothetical protein